jgi:hypothetical protein
VKAVRRWTADQCCTSGIEGYAQLLKPSSETSPAPVPQTPAEAVLAWSSQSARTTHTMSQVLEVWEKLRADAEHS